MVDPPRETRPSSSGAFTAAPTPTPPERIAVEGLCVDYHGVVALHEAIAQFEAEGGQSARLARYTRNYQTLVSGMAALGFRPFLDPAVQAPIIVTFHAPQHPAYEFKRFYDTAKQYGFLLYPGKLTQVETFRVGCIGAIGPVEMRQAVDAVAQTLRDMGISQPALQS